jgi:chorismate mutase
MKDADWLRPYREKIDALDDQILTLLGERFGIVREVGALKTREDITIVQTARVHEVIERNAKRAESENIDPDVIRQIYTILIDYAHILENSIKDAKSKDAKSKEA